MTSVSLICHLVSILWLSTPPGTTTYWISHLTSKKPVQIFVAGLKSRNAYCNDFFFVVLYSDFRVRLPFVNHSLMPDFACLAHHKKLLAQFPKPVVKNHFSTSVNHKLFHYVLWFYVWFVWDMWLPLGASWVMWGQDYNGGRMACEQWIWVGAFVVRSSSLGAWLKIRF